MGHFVQHLVRIEIVCCRCRSSFKHDYFQFYAQGNHRLTSNLVNLLPPANEVPGRQCFYTCLSFSSRERVEGVCIPACTYIPPPSTPLPRSHLYPPEFTYPPYPKSPTCPWKSSTRPVPRSHLSPPLSRYGH